MRSSRVAPLELRLVVAAVAGLLVVHAWLLYLDLAGAPWRAWTVLLILAALLPPTLLTVGAPWLRGRREDEAAETSSRFGWGDAVGLAAVAAVAVVAWSRWSTNPDFIYHWGLKGRRFFLAEGLDLGFLAAPWNEHAHPDYPNLLPDLFAATALLQGRWHEPTLLLWSPFFLLLNLLAARAALRIAGTSRGTQQLTVAAVAVVMGMFMVSHQLIGGPDELISLSLLLAVPALLAGPAALQEPSRDRLVALAAALAVAAKLEGVPLAAFLLAAYALKERLWVRSEKGARLWQRALRLTVPAAVVAAPWLYRVLSLDLVAQSNSGLDGLAALEANLAAVLPAVCWSVAHPHWHGLGLAVLLAPLLLIPRRTRPLAAVCLLQLFFYLAIYLTARQGAEYWVRSSLPRLLIHVVPALVVGVGLVPLGQRSVSQPSRNS